MTMSPLDGVRVLDLSRMLPVGVLSQLLADLGAEVVKVERPITGEEGRAFGARVAGTSSTHAFLDRGKRSVALGGRLGSPTFGSGGRVGSSAA